jgi:hypothetical protein
MPDAQCMRYAITPVPKTCERRMKHYRVSSCRWFESSINCWLRLWTWKNPRASSCYITRLRPNAFRKFISYTDAARKQAAAANLASAATHATDGKPRAQGRFRRRSRTCASCLQIPEPRFPAASSGSRSSPFSGRYLTIEFPKGISLRPACSRLGIRQRRGWAYFDSSRHPQCDSLSRKHGERSGADVGISGTRSSSRQNRREP